MDALAVFRDFVINRKLRSNGKVNYRKNETGIISEFNDFLHKVHMTVEDVEAVMNLKQMSNIMFHQGERSETKETEEKL